MKRVQALSTTATVENVNDLGANTPMNKAPKPVIREGSMGAAKKANLGVVDQSGASARYVKFTLTAVAEDKTFLLGDAAGLVAAVKSGVTFTAPTSLGRSVTHAAFKAFLLARTLTVQGFRISSTNVADLSNDIVIYDANVSGEVTEKVVNIEDAVNGDQYDSKIQNYNVGFTFAPTTGVAVSVTSGATVKFTMWFDGEFM